MYSVIEHSYKINIHIISNFDDGLLLRLYTLKHSIGMAMKLLKRKIKQDKTQGWGQGKWSTEIQPKLSS